MKNVGLFFMALICISTMGCTVDESCIYNKDDKNANYIC